METRHERVASASELLARYAAGERDFYGANLSWANLRGADLSGADLQPIWDDLYSYLDHVPDEVAGLLATLEAGNIDGSTYDGPCACLAGTCERLAGLAAVGSTAAAEAETRIETLIDLRDADSPRERWFLAIRRGDTPANSPIAAITAGKLREYIAAHPQLADGEASHGQ